MDEEEAEDVIFEGSPLFEYLKETCPGEKFESSLPQSREVQQVTFVSPSKGKHTYLGMISSGLGILHIKDTYKKLLSWPVAALDQSHHEQNISCQLRVLSRITQSRLLNEGDQSFLRSVEKYMRDEQQVSHYQPVPLLHIFISGLLFLGSSICFFLPRVTRISLTEQPVMTAAACTEILLGAVLLLIALSICLRGFCQERVSRVYEHLNSELDRCIHQEETFLKCFRRSMQYIQEVEVLSRGYTMVNVPSGNKERSVLQLLPLRKVCLLVIIKHLSVIRAALSGIISGFPIPMEYNLSADSTSNQKIPDWITDMAANSQLLDSHTEEEMFSLSTLKILFGLYKEQCSDFYRQLVISFVYSDELSCASETDLQKLQKWVKIITNTSSECEESTNRLTEAYKVHRWSPTPDVSDKPREVSRREVWRPEVQCTTAIHSLRLHLETMLSRVSSTDDELTDSEVINITDDRVAELQLLMTELADHMEASQICCQEARASLEKLACREEPQKMTGDDSDGEVDEVKSQEPIERILITAEYSEDIDGDLDEQIFEAYIDAKKKLQEEEDSEDWLQERIQRRREAEDAKRMLQELNSVLTKRSKEREKNKQQKLLKQQNKQIESPPPLAVDGMGDCNNIVPPAEHEYSLPATTDTDNSPSVQALGKKDLDNESHSGKWTECDELSLNASDQGDSRVNSTVPPLNVSDQYSSRTHKVPASEASVDLINSPNIDISGCGNISCRSDLSSQINSAKQSSAKKSLESHPNPNMSSPIGLSENHREGAISAEVSEQDVSNPCKPISTEYQDLSGRSKSQSEFTYTGSKGSTGRTDDEGGESGIHQIGSNNDSGSSGIFTSRDSPRTEEDEISESVAPHSYECDSSDGRGKGLVASRDLSKERSSFLAVNPWMTSGLAAQVAKISLERNNLSEETFGEDDSEED